jgi:hypothetical protein
VTDARYATILRGAEAIAARAANALTAMRGGSLDVTRKELRDVVTAADLAAERIVIDGLRELTPDAAIVSEEAGTSGPTGEARWIVDPARRHRQLRGGPPLVLGDDGLPGGRTHARRGGDTRPRPALSRVTPRVASRRSTAVMRAFPRAARSAMPSCRSC